MSFGTWKNRRRARPFRPGLVALEDRSLPATFTVLNLNDSGANSLRDCVAKANANPDADAIVFSAGLGGGIITLTTGELAITQPVTITGPAGIVTVSGNDVSRVINTSAAAAGTAISLDKVTLMDGRATNAPGGAVLIDDEAVSISTCNVSDSTATGAAGFGGAVAMTGNGTLNMFSTTVVLNFASSSAVHLAAGTATLTGIFSVNTAADGGGAISLTGTAVATISNSSISKNSSMRDGGGVYLNGDSKLTIINTLITNNTAQEGPGGGICVQNLPLPGGDIATLIVTGSTISGNFAFGTGPVLFGFGGGIYAGGANLTISQSTISGNTADSDGGGLGARYASSAFIEASTFSANRSSYGSGGGIASRGAMTIRNSTVSGNVARDKGGGIRNSNTGGPLVIHNSTVTLNSAMAGPGISILPQITTFESTIVAQNANVNGEVDAGSGPATLPAVNSLFGALAANITLSGGGNQSGTVAVPLQAKLTPLLALGGPTQTHAPQFGSPILEAGSNPASLVTDQRGEPRVFGSIDIGAVEAVPKTYIVDTIADENDGNFAAGDFSLREAIFLANQISATADTINFSPTVFAAPQTIGLTLGELAVSGPVTISGPAATLTVSGKNSRVFNTTTAPATAAIWFSNFMLANGSSSSDGGAILAGDESLFVNAASVVSSTAQGNGGGICLLGPGQISVINSTFKGNSAGASGGAILLISGGSLSVSGSSFSGHTAAGTGGAIALANGASFLLLGSTLSGNSSTGGHGGAVSSFGTLGPTWAVRNSTISGNVSFTSGGAIGFGGTAASGGTAVFSNSTITGNTGATQGGVIRIGGVMTFDFDSSIIDNNFTTLFQPSDISSGGLVNVDRCAVGPITGYTLTGANNLIDAALKLGPLAPNGGTTLTHLPATDSPLLSVGSNPASLPTDQRGRPRVVGTGIDIGAVEVSAARVASVTVNGGAVQRSRVLTVDVAFDSLVTVSAAAFSLVRQSDNFAAALTVNVVNTSFTTATFTFAGAGAEHGSLMDGRYTLTVDADLAFNSVGLLDGNGDGVAGDDFVLIGNSAAAPKLYRLFGDVDANGTVDGSDLAAFGTAFGQTVSNSPFDFDANGTIDAADYSQFGNRFGVTL